MRLSFENRLSASQKTIISRFSSDYPVQLGALARELGIAKIKIGSLRTGISGQIMKDNSEYVIRLNRNEARERQRFTLAHEIAHFLLHKELIDSLPTGISDNVLYRSGAPERVEFEANRLAADIVMPLDLIKKKLDGEYFGIINEEIIERLASLFGVSKAAMEIRLSNFDKAA